MTERKLVTIRVIDSVEKHPNADVLDLARGIPKPVPADPAISICWRTATGN